MSPVTLVSHGFQSHYEVGFANGLAANGVAVTLLGSDTTLVQRLHPAIRFLNLRGAQSDDRPRLAKALNMLRYHARLLWFVATHGHHVTMVIGLLYPPWRVGVLETALFRLFSKRLTVTVHNVLPHDRHTRSQRLAHGLLYRIPQWLIAHTESTRQALAHEFGIDVSRVIVVPHGSNDAVAPCPISAEQLRHDAGIAPGRTALLYFGAVLPYKGLDLLLDAIECDDRVHLVVAGRCVHGDYSRTVRARLEVLRQSGRLTFEDGFVADERIGPLFRMADAVVLPYRHIDQSGVLLLALTLGVPVIATDVGEFRAMLDSDTGVVAADASSSAIAQAINQFIAQRNRFLSAEIARRAQRFAWRTTVQPALEVLA